MQELYKDYTSLMNLNGRHQFNVGHVTHAGIDNENNEDSYVHAPDQGLWLVADGLGGHEDGEIASAIVTTKVMEYKKKGLLMCQALDAAHNAIFSAAKAGVGSEGMGSTVVVLSLNGHNYRVSWCGNSRAYLWNGSLRQLTSDHTIIQRLLDQGKLAEEDIEQHPDRHLLCHSIGSRLCKDVYMDQVTGVLDPTDSILLCSDGLTNELSDVEIAAILSLQGSEQDKVDYLLASALEHGGRDNITIILVGMDMSRRSV